MDVPDGLETPRGGTGRKKQRPHWYKTFVGECPVCGRDRSYRVRVYGRPPRDRRKRYVHLSDAACYDWCDI